MPASPPVGDAAGRPPGLAVLFTAFLKIGALGFGGVAPLARHVLVVERRLLEEQAYAELFGFASTLPGANTVNLATLLGDRYAGGRGAAVAVGGLMGAPLLILLAFASLLQRFGEQPDVRAGLAGAAAAAAGLVGGTALRLLASLGSDVAVIVPAAAVCLAAAVLRLPLPLILAAAIPASIALQTVRTRRRRA